MHGFGKVLLASLFASGTLAMPWAQGGTTDSTAQQNTNTQTTGPSTEQIKSSGTGGKIAEGEPIPEVSDVGPAYSLLLAKEIAPTDLDGVIVAWAYGLPFCTQRQLLSESIEDFCNKNLTFDRVPKLDENLQATGEVTQISGYFAGCSDDVSLGRSYAGLYWVEVVGMYDGVGDQPAAAGGTDGTVQRTTNTNTNSGSGSGTPPATQNTQQNTQSTSSGGGSSGGTGTGTGTGTGNGGVRGPAEEPTPGKTAYKCNNDRESHECPRGNNAEVDIISFCSCGQYAYTDKKGQPGTGGGGSSGGTTSTDSTTTPPTTNNQQQGTTQQGGGGGGMGGRKYKTLRALKA